MTPPPATVQSWLRDATSALTANATPNAAGDARRLLCLGLKIDAAALIADPSRSLTPDETGSLSVLLARRLAHEPIARIAGSRDFYGRTFTITPDVLDPRPDTETLVEAALSFAQHHHMHGPLSILDLGTGSGAILLTLLAELPQAIGTGIDVSPAALACAQANATRLDLTARAAFSLADMLELTTTDLESFDLVVSNPPYIPTHTIPVLMPDVALYDPHLALDGGADGLDFYRHLLVVWAALPVSEKPQCLMLEIGSDQAPAVQALAHAVINSSDRRTFALRHDLNDLPRVLTSVNGFMR